MHADATVILQDAEVFGQEGTNVTVCAEIQLPGQLLSEINVQFVALSGGFGAGKIIFVTLKLSHDQYTIM